MLEQEFMKEVFKRFDKIDAKLGEHSKILNEHTNTINLLKDTVRDNTKCILENTKKIEENTKKIDENSEKIDELSEYYRAHNRTLIRFETEIDQKMGALFDSYVANHDEHKIYYSGINDLNQQIFEHNVRISALEELHKSKLA